MSRATELDLDMQSSPNFWNDLLGTAGAAASQLVSMRLLRKVGYPFLLLAQSRKAAAATFDLYPAQTPKARAARFLFRRLFGAGLALGTENVSVPISFADPYLNFLSELAGTTANSPPLFS